MKPVHFLQCLKVLAFVTATAFSLGVIADQNYGKSNGADIGADNLVENKETSNRTAKKELHKHKSSSNYNEELVVQFYDKIFNQRLDVKATAMQYLAEDYIQHNPYVPTGRNGFIDALGSYLPSVPNTQWDIKQVITDGDLVVLHVHAYSPNDNNPGTALVYIFRVHRGKIVEHWDVVQQIPEQMAHSNGMF